MARDKQEKGKGKSKGEDKGSREKGDSKGEKGDRSGGKSDRGKGKGKDKDDRSRSDGKLNDREGESDKPQRSQLSSAAADFTPSMGNYAMFGDFCEWPVAPAAPPLWREYKDEDEVPYFHNAKTGLCQWEKPPELEPPKPPPPEKLEVTRGERRDRDGGMRDSDRDERRNDGDRGGRKGGDGGKGGRRRKPDDSKKDGSDFGPPGCNLFVFHLPDDWADDDLHEYFAPHGNVISAKVMKELGTGRSRGFGFVSYEDRVSSATAVKKMQGYKILGKRLKVEFKKGEQDGGQGDGEKGDDSGGDGEGGGSGKKAYPDDERLIGYLRAISAKNVVQSLKESESGDARPMGEQEDESEGGGGSASVLPLGGDLSAPLGGDLED